MTMTSVILNLLLVEGRQTDRHLLNRLSVTLEEETIQLVCGPHQLYMLHCSNKF